MSTTVPKEELRALVASMADLPVELVIWSGEPIPPVAYEQDARRVTLNVLSRRPVGKDETTRSYPDASTIRLSYKGQRLLSISIRAENFGDEEGFDLLESLRTQFEQPDNGAVLNASDLSVNGTGEVRNLDAYAHNRAISVAQLDVTFNQVVTRVVDKIVSDTNPSYIESVEMTGDPELALAGTSTVVAPP